MKQLLEESGLIVVDTKGFRIDFEEYDIIDFTGIEKGDIFYRRNRTQISAENYLIESFKKGFGIFVDGNVYYGVNLIPHIINPKKIRLEEHISSLVKLEKLDRYKIKKYLVSPEYEIFVKNAMRFYDKGFDIEFVRNKLVGRVKDVEVFLEYLENRNLDNRKNTIAS